MLYLIGAAVAVTLGWWAYARLRPFLQRGGVRIAAGGMSALAFGAAAFSATRESWTKVVILAIVGFWMLMLARTPRDKTNGKAAARKSDPSLEEARAILGVGAEATAAEVQEAYLRLIRRAHPDSGGTSGLAAQLNAARDRLLGS